MNWLIVSSIIGCRGSSVADLCVHRTAHRRILTDDKWKSVGYDYHRSELFVTEHQLPEPFGLSARPDNGQLARVA